MRIRFDKCFIVGALLPVVLLGWLATPARPALGFNFNNYQQTSLQYCFTSSMGSAAQARFRDALQTWNSRAAALAWSEVNCSVSSALTVSKDSIDGSGPIIAVTHFNGLNHPVNVIFDETVTWNTSTSSPGCGEGDMWGVAAHELGHVWGLGHSSDAPDGGLNTMNSTFVLVCPASNSQYARTLNEDDESGVLAITSNRWLPNPGFERTTDCSSGLGCEDDYYWNGSGATRVCDASNAYIGSCYARMVNDGELNQSVYHVVPSYSTSHGFSFYANNRGSSSGTLDVIVKDLTTGNTKLSSSCTIPATSTWHLCQFYWINGTGTSDDEFKYRIIKNGVVNTMWFDSVRADY